MPSNNHFWIFPNANAVSVTYNPGPYNHTAYVNNIYGLFNTPVATVGPGRAAPAALHVPHYYTDDAPRLHALNAALCQAENNMDTIMRNASHAPVQGRGTAILIGGVRVYHETGTHRASGGICTIFYTFNHTTRVMTVHAVGAHTRDGYSLDCASVDFDTAVTGLGRAQWGYVTRGIVRL